MDPSKWADCDVIGIAVSCWMAKTGSHPASQASRVFLDLERILSDPEKALSDLARAFSDLESAL